MNTEKLHCRTAFTSFYYIGAIPFKFKWVSEIENFQISAAPRIAYYLGLLSLIITTIHYFFITFALIRNISEYIQNKAYLEITFHGFWILAQTFQFQYGFFHLFKLIEIQSVTNGIITFIVGLRKRTCHSYLSYIIKLSNFSEIVVFSQATGRSGSFWTEVTNQYGLSLLGYILMHTQLHGSTLLQCISFSKMTSGNWDLYFINFCDIFILTVLYGRVLLDWLSKNGPFGTSGVCT